MSSIHKRRLTPSAILGAGVSSSVDPQGFFRGGVQPSAGNVIQREQLNQLSRIGGIDGPPVRGLADSLIRAGAVSSLDDAKRMALGDGNNSTGDAQYITSMHSGHFADIESMERAVDPRHSKLMFAARIPKSMSTHPHDIAFATLAKTNSLLSDSWSHYISKVLKHASNAADAEPHPNSLAARMYLGKRMRLDAAEAASSKVHPLNVNSDVTYNVRFFDEFWSKYAYLGVTMAGENPEPAESLRHAVRQLLTICNQGRITHLKNIFGPTVHGDRLYLAVLRPNTPNETQDFDITQLRPLKIVPVVARQGAGVIFNSSICPLLGLERATMESMQDCMSIVQRGESTPWRGRIPQHVGLSANAAYNENYALFHGAQCGVEAFAKGAPDIYSPDVSFVDVRVVTPHHACDVDPQNGNVIRRGTANSAEEHIVAKCKHAEPFVAVGLFTALMNYIGFVENTVTGERGGSDQSRAQALINPLAENLEPGTVSIFAEM